MKVKSATIEIRPRKATEIIDLAMLFYRTHLPVLFSVLAVLGVPLVAAAVGLHYLTGEAWISLCFFWLTLSIPTGAVVLTASKLVFGNRLTAQDAISLYRGEWFGLFMRRLGQKILVVALIPIIVGYLLRLRWAFTPMIVLLERLAGRALALRRRGLRRRGGASALGMDILLFLVTVTVLLGIMIVLELVFGNILALWTDDGLLSEAVFNEPLKLGVWMLALLAITPVGTLSWFFLYLDSRIRGEGWDLELGLKATASRIPPDEEVA
jgi:hypothetical protein